VPKISIITPFSRGIKELSQLLRDFRNQTFKDSEHLIISDGKPSQDITDFMKSHEKDYNVKFTWIKKDHGDMRVAPGTGPRNYGVSIAKSEYVVFCDDDDRYSDRYLESLILNTHDNYISVVQMACQESRVYKNGDKNRTMLIPEIGLTQFPVICHVGTPCFIVRREWALAEPWRHEPEHDFRFIKRICDKFHPIVQIVGGMQIDVDGLVTRGIRDWVSMPPFYREGVSLQRSE
jgi:glycosyltransferase involved in cell wall biosynthesis